jgi:hypothetical protein
MDALRNQGRRNAVDPGDAYDFLYLTEVGIVDHSGDSQNRPGATCEAVEDVNEDRVNQLLDIGRPLGRFSMVNNCRSFAFDVLIHSRNGYRPLPDPHPAMIRVLRTGGRGRDL